MRTSKAIKNGEFVLEFEGNLLTKSQCEEAEKEYEKDGKPVYILEAHGHYFDPTMHPSALGKYINHTAQGANLKLFPPIEARGRMRVGFCSHQKY